MEVLRGVGLEDFKKLRARSTLAHLFLLYWSVMEMSREDKNRESHLSDLFMHVGEPNMRNKKDNCIQIINERKRRKRD